MREEDLYYHREMGVAWQRDMSVSIHYGKRYWDKLKSYENKDIAKKINKGRVDIVKKYCKNFIIDVGIGCGEFIENVLKYNNNLQILGYDINKYAIKWLNDKSMYIDILKKIPYYTEGLTFWDTFEHIKNPSIILNKMSVGRYIFISIPIFKNLDDIKRSKHYRPDEHYYYFTNKGLKKWLNNYRFDFIEKQNFEIKAGRENIYTYVFEKNDRERNKKIKTLYI